MNILLTFFLITVAQAQTFIGDSFSAKYEETGVSKIGKKLTTLGQIDYQHPSRLKLEITKPDHVVIVMNETKTWHYQQSFIPTEKSTVDISTSTSHPILKVFKALRSGLKNTDIYDLSNDGKDISLVFKPKAREEFGILKLVLRSSKGPGKIVRLSDVEELETHDSKGSVITRKFQDFKTDVKFDPDYFTFKIPENTKIQNH